MPFHRLPDDLVSLIAKHALLMEVEEYGPSEDERFWPISTHFTPTTPFQPRVSEVLEYVNRPIPPLVCDPCDQNQLAFRTFDRTMFEGRMIELWEHFCPNCDWTSSHEASKRAELARKLKRKKTLYWVSLQLSIQEANLRAEAEAEANFGSSDLWAEEVD